MVRTRFFKRRALRVAVPSLVLCGILAGIALFAGSTARAAACDGTDVSSCEIAGSITLNPGTLTLSAPATLTFPATPITNLDQSVETGSTTLTVNDARGTGAAWYLTASATKFTCTTPGATDGCTATGTPDALGALTLNGSTGSAGAGTTPTATCSPACSNPTSTASYPTADITAGSTAIFTYDGTAGGTTGMGINTINNADWWLAIPATAKPGTYQSTITLVVSSNP